MGMIVRDIQAIMGNEKLTPLEYLGKIAILKDIGKNPILNALGEGVVIIDGKKYALICPDSTPEEVVLKLIGTIRMCHISQLAPWVDKIGELEYFIEKMQTGTSPKHTQDKAYA